MTQKVHTQYKNNNSPVPPLEHKRHAGHHWLDVYDTDGHYFDTRVLQWNPVAQEWSHSGLVSTGVFVDTTNWVYNQPCPMPDVAELT